MWRTCSDALPALLELVGASVQGLLIGGSATGTWATLLVPVYPRGKRTLGGGIQTAVHNHGMSKGKTCSCEEGARPWNTSAGQGQGVKRHFICLVSVNDNLMFSVFQAKSFSHL